MSTEYMYFLLNERNISHDTRKESILYRCILEAGPDTISLMPLQFIHFPYSKLVTIQPEVFNKCHANAATLIHSTNQIQSQTNTPPVYHDEDAVQQIVFTFLNKKLN